MRRCAWFLTLACGLLAGCGNVNVNSHFDPGTAGTGSASGTVSVVHLTFTSDAGGNSITVTTVTLLQHGGAQDLTFCGSHADQFPMNEFVQANYEPGPTCSNLVSVRIGY